MTEETKALTDKIVEGIHDKKGKGVTIIDLSEIDGSITKAFVICEGSSPSQIAAIADSVGEKMRIDLQEKPTTVVGLENCIWVAMDYVDVMVHIFVPEARDHYDLEHLWSDAPTMSVADIE